MIETSRLPILICQTKCDHSMEAVDEDILVNGNVFFLHIKYLDGKHGSKRIDKTNSVSHPMLSSE